MSDDLISRQAAIATAISGRVRTLPTTEDGEDWIRVNEVRESLLNLPTAEPDMARAIATILENEQDMRVIKKNAEPRWIPITTRPMDEEERAYYEETLSWELTDDEAVVFTCEMPDDGQEVWVCSKCGNVWQDTCCIDEGIGLEGNGDWDDIVAWMPFTKPKPWKGESDATD